MTPHHSPWILLRPALALAALLLAACALTPAAGIRVQDGALVQLLPGQSARLADGSHLHFVDVVADSRCPPDVHCIWAGDAELMLQWHRSPDDVRPLRIHTNPEAGPDRLLLGQRSVTLVALGRDTPEASFRIERHAAAAPAEQP